MKYPITMSAFLALALAVSAQTNTNTFVGTGAGAKNTTGESNTAVGFKASNANTSGGFNVAVGDGALLNNKIGNNNVGIGVDAGANLTKDDNICIDNPGKAEDLGVIRLGRTGVHNKTYVAGKIFGDGSGLKNVKVAPSNIQGAIPGGKIAASSITSTKLAGSSVTSAAVANGAITSGKLGSDLTLAGTTTGTFSGSLNGSALTAQGVLNDNVKISYTTTGTFGNANGHQFNGSLPGLLIETKEASMPNVSAGMFLHNDHVIVYGGGDTNVFQVNSESNLNGQPLFQVKKSTNGIETAGPAIFGGAVQANGAGTFQKGTAVCAPEELRIIRGGVLSTGVKFNGSGFTSSRSSTGIYIVSFTTSFSNSNITPVITCNNNSLFRVATIMSTGASSFVVRTFDNTGTLADSAFSFIVTGD